MAKAKAKPMVMTGCDQRVAIFGGTFDPVHLGHLEVARKAKESLELGRVVFVPCQQSPHKDRQPGASGEQRLAMLRLATEGLDWAVVDDLELRSSEPSLTWKTIEAYRREQPDCELFLLIGDDQWEALPRWSRPDYLAGQVEFIVVGRHGGLIERAGYRANLLDGDHPASASQIRNQIRAGEHPDWLDPKVAVYIERENLYR